MYVCRMNPDFSKYVFSSGERLMRYVQLDTQSDPNSNTFPTTEKQKDLSRILVQELISLGIIDAEMDEFGYVYATVPSNVNHHVPVIAFCSHVDTAPDCSGANVKPILHQNYQGQDLVLPEDSTIILSPKDFPYLIEKIGDDIITASGNTLLGGDDKGGVAIIMDLVQYLQQHPEVPHGTIKILFTPDEEVGKGTAKVDLMRLGAAYGYTLDGGEAGSFEDETFSADGAKVTVHGVIAHPGYAKGQLVNALKIVGEILAELPKGEWSPETTEKREGFIHPITMGGLAEKAFVDFIVRDFDDEGLLKHEERLTQIVKDIVSKHPGATYQMEVKEQYRNMKKILDTVPFVSDYAVEAIERTGLKVTRMPIRGGTDGSRLSYMGLPCPNIFTGMQGIHGKREWISVQDMQKSTITLVHLSMIWAERNR